MIKIAMLCTMKLSKVTGFKTVSAAREALGRAEERFKLPRRLNKVVPRKGTSHEGVTRACKRVWSYHDRMFPRRCEHCIHFDYKRGQDSLHGRLADGEADMLNVTAQQHLMQDFAWDVDGVTVNVDTNQLGGCDVHDAYVLPTGTCVHFERTPGGALVPPEDRVETKAEEVTGWKPPVDPEEDATPTPEAVVYPDDSVVRPEAVGGERVQDGAKSDG